MSPLLRYVYHILGARRTWRITCFEALSESSGLPDPRRVFDDRSVGRALRGYLNVMIDCAPDSEEAEPRLLLLDSASTHIRRPSFSLCRARIVSPPEATHRPSTYILPLASSHPHYVRRRRRRRYRLHFVPNRPHRRPKCYYVAHARAALRSCARRLCRSPPFSDCLSSRRRLISLTFS